jgi:hypothetical protein
MLLQPLVVQSLRKESVAETFFVRHRLMTLGGQPFPYLGMIVGELQTAIKMAIMAITTKSSISVKANLRLNLARGPRFLPDKQRP